MEVIELKKSDEIKWDGYVMESKDSTFYHQIGWRNVVEKTYGHKPIYLIAKEDNETKGILPLSLMKSKIFGTKLISIPFASYGGICADNDKARDILLNKAETITKDENARYLELRYAHKSKSNLIIDKRYFTSILELNSDSGIVWRNFSKKVRNSTRKAVKSDIEILTDKEYLDDFYGMYAKNLRDLGTPVHSTNFFKNILVEFPQSEVMIAKYKGIVIAGMLLLRFKNIIISGWAGSLRNYLKLCPNNLLYWNAIKAGCETGFHYFDFGRSIPQSGTFRFKKAWGGEPKQLYYQYYLKMSRIPDTSQSNSKRKIFANIWRCLPISVVNTLGPKLRKNFP